MSRHFPDRLHEFVWRNWNLVEPAKLAKVVSASAQDIMAIAESMGLPPAADIPEEQRSRGYITVIRRNWHLLPYDQLLELLDMTPARLAFTLREDDGVWAKLGYLKPRCAPLRYHPPDEAVRRRAAEIKRLVEETFADEMRRPAAPRFEFVRQLSTPLPSYHPPKAEDAQSLSLRYIYSYFSLFGDPLMNPALDPYPDGLLQRLSTLGINGVWLHVLLRDMAPGGAAFPEFGEGHERRLATLRTLVNRAKKCGIGVYLYMDEPRAMPPDDVRFRDFFQAPGRAAMAGVRSGEYTAMCTSHPVVRQWMSDALAHIFHEVPDLAGVFTITASEGLTNCASHYGWKSCPHCKNRTDADIIAEVNRVIAEGVHRGNPKANVLAWDWGWRGNGDASEIITQLPKSVWLMSVSEWAIPIDRGGVKTAIGEYALSAGGPGPRNTPLGASQESRFENGGQDAVEQYVGIVVRALHTRDGPGGRALPQLGSGAHRRHDAKLESGWLSVTESGDCRSFPHPADAQCRRRAQCGGAGALWNRRRPASATSLDRFQQSVP